jgi:cell division transport system permease protein
VRDLVEATGRGVLRALRSLQRRPFRTALATGAISVALLLVGGVYLAARNVELATARWGRGVQMVVYLEEGISAERAERIGGALLDVPAVEKVEQVSPEAAFERLRGALGDHDEIIAGIEVGMLPASIEVTLREGVSDVVAGHSMVERLQATPGVEEVEFLGGWVSRLTALTVALRYAFWFLFALVGLACAYTIAATLRLSMQARDREVESETFELLGASGRFVRGPMVVEGALQGAAGAVAAAGLLWLLFRATSDAIGMALASSIGAVEPVFLSVSDVAILIAVGAAFGFVGSWMASGRRAFA